MSGWSVAVRVEVRLIGVFREAAGSTRLVIEVEEGSRLVDVVDRVVEGVPGLGDVLVDRVVESYAPNALVLVNGVEASNLEGPMTPIGDGSTLVLLPVTHGG